MIEEVSPADFHKRRADGELWQLLDVREPWEIEVASVDDAICLPMTEIPERLNELDRARPVAVLCHSGVRSARVAAFLMQNGFASVANVTGGIDAWSQTVDRSVPRY